MNGVEELIQVMRSEGKYVAAPGIQIGTMTSGNSVNLGGLLLKSEDLMFSEHLLKSLAISTGGYTQPLQEGDEVAIVRTSDTRYLVLGKLVRA